MTAHVTCPHCSARIDNSPHLAAGEEIHCEKCDKKFSPDEHSPSHRVPEGKLVAKKKHAHKSAVALMSVPAGPDVDSHTAIKPQVTRKASTKAPVAVPFSPPPGNGKSRLLVVALVLGLAFLLVGSAGAVGVALLLGQSKEPEPANVDDAPIASMDTPTLPVDEWKDTQKSIRPANGKSPPAQTASLSKKSQDANLGLSPPPNTKETPDTRQTPSGKNLDKNAIASYRSTLSKENQRKVNDAIDRGVKWLRSIQNKKDGSWSNGRYPVGYTALAGLTLLECGGNPLDPAVCKAADYVRFYAPNLTKRSTYQLSLTILFLDKLGDNRDKDLIRRLALRLIAGQTAAGGWYYQCPILTRSENFELVVFLQKTRPLPTPIGGKGNKTEVPIAKGGKNDLSTLIGGKRKDLQTTVAGKPKKKSAGRTGIILPFDEQEATKSDGKKKSDVRPAKNSGGKGTVRPANNKPFPIRSLSPRIRSLPIVQQQPLPRKARNRRWGRGRGRPQFGLRSGRDDNSNTQFAMLALWAARRHGIPVERTLTLVDKRFEVSQNPNGGWGYAFRRPATTPQMTCVGLIGLAIGHGAYKEIYGNNWKDKNKAQKDPRIHKGLQYLGGQVGSPPKDWKMAAPLTNLYFLWSLERTAMLYNLKTIGGHDWYGWAAHQLVTNQNIDGYWTGGGYPDSTAPLDTCMALLILRRANLTQDLSESLRLYIPIVDPGRKK